jgi:sugar lactone lactonase YvrE
VALTAILGPPALCAQEVNLDSRVRIQFGDVRYGRAEEIVTSGTLTNISSDVLLEPLALVLTSVSPGVTLANASGQTGDGLPFVSVPLPDGLLGPGGHVKDLVLKFKSPSETDIRFTTSVRGGLSVVESLLETQGELVGVAVASDGTAYVSNVEDGEIFRVDPTGSASIIAAGLRRPSGLALDGVDLLIAEEGAGRVLRLTPTGALTALAKGMRAPRWLATGHDGSIYIAAHRLLGSDGSDPDEANVIVRRDPSTGQLDVVATDVHQLEALALNSTALFAAAVWVEGLPPAEGVIARYPLLPDGRLAPPTYFVPDGLQNPRGLVLDELASLYVTPRSRAIVKVHGDAHLTPFAVSLADPRGLALGPDGSLYVADGRSGRLLRFRAPPAPSLAGLPAFTRESPLTVSGTAVPIARVDLFVNDATTAVTGFADNRGAFSLAAPLALNSRNTLEVFATARLGDGLTSAAAQASVGHDNQPPTINFVTPLANAFVRQTVTVQAQASGAGGSAVASLALSAGDQPLAVTLSPAPPAPSVMATASWNTSDNPDGARTLTAAATDQAGNTAAATRAVIVDNTPPDTQITAGPSGVITDTSATFAVTGSDNLAPVAQLQYAWRLDGGAYSAFDPSKQIPLSSLTQGGHTFEVKTRDLAGNEDPTPAQQSFTVSGLSVQITSPAAATTVPAGLLLVRGTVNAGGAEVGVTVNRRPAAVQGSVFAALVPVDQSTNQLLAVATTSSGSTTSTAIAIGVTGSPTDAFVLRPSAESGTAPLQVTFAVSGPRPVTQVALDFDGNGSVDFQGPSLDGERFTYTQPGLYVATVTVTDSQGAQTSTGAVIQVLDRSQLDALLQGKWNALRDALSRADVPAAVSLFALASRDAYQDQLGALAGVGALQQIATDLGGIRIVRTMSNAAEYEVRALRNAVEYSFYVLFVVDSDDVWRLRVF